MSVAILLRYILNNTTCVDCERYNHSANKGEFTVWYSECVMLFPMFARFTSISSSVWFFCSTAVSYSNTFLRFVNENCKIFDIESPNFLLFTY